MSPQTAWKLLSEFFHRTWWLLPIASMGGIFALFYLGYFPLNGKDIAERGQFGDSFGVLNSLFTGLGFGGLVVTLVLQQKQLRQQEQQIHAQQVAELTKHYEETLHRLLALYTATLSEVSTVRGDLRGRSVLRGSTDRVFEAVKKEGIHIVPHAVQGRYAARNLTTEDREVLDYLYFRNFKILSVEIDRQGRLIASLKVLLQHLVHRLPSHLPLEPYKDLVCAQMTYVEVSYFFLVALSFKDEHDLRELLLRSGLLAKAAQVKRLRVHDYMYEEFWDQNVRAFKRPTLLPMSDRRIDSAVRAHRRRMGAKIDGNPKTYTSPRTVAPEPDGSAN
jgi:hypothetical protein